MVRQTLEQLEAVGIPIADALSARHKNLGREKTTEQGRLPVITSLRLCWSALAVAHRESVLGPLTPASTTLGVRMPNSLLCYMVCLWAVAIKLDLISTGLASPG